MPPSKPKPASTLVYSTEHGRMCPGCRNPVSQCSCRRQAAPAAKSDGIVRVRLETKGRKGKGVTVVLGVPLDGEALENLGKQLRQACGAGGTVKSGQIEIQGDHCTQVMATLTRAGYTVRRAGG